MSSKAIQVTAVTIGLLFILTITVINLSSKPQYATYITATGHQLLQKYLPHRLTLVTGSDTTANSTEEKWSPNTSQYQYTKGDNILKQFNLSMVSTKSENNDIPWDSNENTSSIIKTDSIPNSTALLPNLNDVHKNPTQTLVPPLVNSTSRPVTRVLLITYYRGGSTFLGEMFGKNPDVFYWFEPLHAYQNSPYSRPGNSIDDDYSQYHNGTVQQHMPLSFSQRVETIQNTLLCQGSSLRTEVLSDMFFRTGQSMPKLRNYTRCLKNKTGIPNKHQLCSILLDTECSRQPIVAVKAIRYPMYLVEYILKVIPDLKVIHYVRDPRGTMASRSRIHHFSGVTLSQNAKKLCLKMVENQKIFDSFKLSKPQNYMVFKYEDLATSPENTARAIYKFIGHKFPENLLSWIEQNTKAAKKDWEYGTQRNSTKVVNEWKTYMNKKDINDITSQCETVLQTFNFPRL